MGKQVIPCLIRFPCLLFPGGLFSLFLFSLSSQKAYAFFAVSHGFLHSTGGNVLPSYYMRNPVFRRKIYKEILEWKEERSEKYALLIKGARRVGKSTIVEEFAKKEFKSYILIDFAHNVTHQFPELCHAFFRGKGIYR